MQPNLSLERPIIFFDTETTGVERTKDRIIELSTIKCFPNDEIEKLTQRFNPTIPIPKEATDVHGITDDDVVDEPTFAEKAVEISSYFLGCDVGGYNVIGFDIPILVEEILRGGANLPFDSSTKVLDSMKIFHQKEKRDLTAALKFYCNKEMVNAHSAEADTVAAIEIMNGQIGKYGFEDSVSTLHDFCSAGNQTIDYEGKFKRNALNQIVFTFGQHKDKEQIPKRII